MSLTITRSGRQADRRYGGRSHCEAVQPPKQSWRCGKEPRIAHPASAQKVWRSMILRDQVAAGDARRQADLHLRTQRMPLR
jgi:hypothetical protein